MKEPLTPTAAKALILAIVAEFLNGSVRLDHHAAQEMAKDGLQMADVMNVLRGGAVEPAEMRNGTWRYPVRTARIWVVIAFRSETSLVVVTAWRKVATK